METYGGATRWRDDYGRMPRRILVALTTLLGLADLAGGIPLALRPDGSALGMSTAWLRGAFPDFLVPGLLLTAMGALCLLAALAIARRWRVDWALGVMAGGGMVIWIVVQYAIVRMYHPLQIVIALWGLLVLAMSIPMVPALRSVRAP